MSRPRPLPVDLLTAVLVLADADADRLVLDRLDHGADARRALAGRADDHHVRDRQRRRLLDDPAGDDLGAAHAARVLNRARTLVPLDHVHVLDEDAAVLRQRRDHAALLAAVLALQHLDDVALADLQGLAHLQHLRGERDDLHEVLLAQLARDRAEDARPARVALVVDDHGCVLVERDRRSVLAPEGLLRPDDDGSHDLALLHRALRRGGLDRADDDVADARVAAVVAAHHADAEELAGAGVVGDLQTGLLLDHRAASTISASRQRFVADSGRVSTMRTTSPTLAAFCSSCAWNLTERRTTFLYFGCALIVSTLTTIVLSIASETTTPRRSWLRPRSCSGFSSRTIGLRVAARSRVGRVFLVRSERGRRLPFFLGCDCGAGTASASSAGAATASGASAGASSAAGSGWTSAAGSSTAASSAAGSGSASATGSSTAASSTAGSASAAGSST